MKILQFGILLLPGYQWLDIAGPVDYLNQHTEYMLSGIAPEAAAKAPNINWHYISDLGNLDPVNATSGPAQIPTTTFKTSPRLDYLLVPGGNPNYQLSNQTTTFIETQLPGLKSLLTVCTGSMILAHTGILDGIHVATNKYALRFSAQVKDF
ncbi:class I glutamine amidotransferase-like protein, partial [Ephemerocybe angulata]